MTDAELLAVLKALLTAWDDWYDGIPVSGELANALDRAHWAVMKAQEGK
jgi:hypothetical protein